MSQKARTATNRWRAFSGRFIRSKYNRANPRMTATGDNGVKKAEPLADAEAQGRERDLKE